MFPAEDEIRRAAQLIRDGNLVAFPTETVYGLGANALDVDAVRRIYSAKGRPASSPLIVHVAEIALAKQLTKEWSATAGALATRFWPGPLTLVVPKHSSMPDIVTAGLPSVALRIPAHPVALRLMQLAGVPVAAPSANRFMHLSPTTAEHVRIGLGDRVEMILDGGPAQVGIESTVVSLTGERPVVLRPGMISLEELQAATGTEWGALPAAEPHIIEMNIATEGAAESPGLHPRHYAPHTPFYVLAAGSARPEGRGRVLELPEDPTAYASYLYAALHAADKQGWDWIAVEEPPQGPGWTGIRDRLHRATTKL
jgi:L-threonylcarbamoyladenylate synthase